MDADDRRYEDLKQSADYLESLLNFSTDAIMIADRHGKPLIFSRSYAAVMKEALGLDMKPGIQPHKLLSDPRAVAYWDDLQRRVLGGETFTAEYSHSFGPGDVRHFSVSFHPIIKDGEVTGFSELTREITKRRDVEEALRASEARFRTVIESIPFDLFAVGKDGRYSIQNTICREQYGNILGKRPAEVADDPDTLATWEESNRRAFAGEVVKGEVTFSLKGETRHIYNVIAPIFNGAEVDAILGVNVDITDQKRIEHELNRKHRLDSLGLLAGGIAHDFNNLLSGLFGHIEMARLAANSPDEVIRQLDDALSCFAKTRDLTRQLLTFAKGGAPMKRVVRLSPIVEEAARLALSGSALELDLHRPDETLCVDADPSQLSQVFNNIIINARHAMPNGGSVRVDICRESLTEGQVHDLPGGDFARVTVSDQGTGIPADFLPRVFDPFFTTKQQGSGLGLSTSYSIVKKHGGDVAIDSQLDRGTAVSIRLPVVDGPAAEECHGADGFEPGSGRVLVMDDEPSVLKILSLMLGKMGYEVDGAGHGEEAVALYRKALGDGDRYRFALLDLTVAGGMGGEEAVRLISEMDPEVKGIASSGYSVGSVFADPGRHGFAAAIAKPIRMRDLGRVLSEVLSR